MVWVFISETRPSIACWIRGAIGACFWYLHGIFKWADGITGNACGPIFDVASPWAQRIHSGGQLFLYNVQPDHDGGIGISGVVHRNRCGDFDRRSGLRIHRCEIWNRDPRTPVGKRISKYHFGNVNTDEHQFVNVVVRRAKLTNSFGATLGFRDYAPTNVAFTGASDFASMASICVVKSARKAAFSASISCACEQYR